MLQENPNEAIMPDYTAEEHSTLSELSLEAIYLQKEEDEEQHLQLQQEEEEATKLEEWKKNKNKYALIWHGKVPSDLSVIPAAYAI
ncbi:uncharacterized protein EDB93DRAFT_1250786 [Suillus bovinus]|uniref:uncharacterized protein n=1 Tax=Suillus bovinus TaxID=48563 RepID=UPI001B873095|nr:uncharacterized protein EDB93DRAFT_1250786 [Suillus bovinus]KAG2146504.1 hypothetical protein EDB93DRAFT_1250786 [Suillus bovinus]